MSIPRRYRAAVGESRLLGPFELHLGIHSAKLLVAFAADLGQDQFVVLRQCEDHTVGNDEVLLARPLAIHPLPEQPPSSRSVACRKPAACCRQSRRPRLVNGHRVEGVGLQLRTEVPLGELDLPVGGLHLQARGEVLAFAFTGATNSLAPTATGVLTSPMLIGAG